MSREHTNEEFLAELMRFSRHGALVQVFVLQALREYATAVAAADPAEIERSSNGLISAHAWIGVAKEVRDKVTQHLTAPIAEVAEPEVANEEVEPGGCTHSGGHRWVYTGTAYGGDDPSYHGEGRCYCEHCGLDGDG